MSFNKKHDAQEVESFSATTIYSGDTNIYDLFVPVGSTGGGGGSTLFAHKGVTLADPPFENNTDIPALVDTWNLSIQSPGTYEIKVTVEYNINVISRDAIFRFDLNGVAGININQESKDATNVIFFTTFAFDELISGNNTIEFYASIENPQNLSQRVQVLSNRLTAQKIGGMS